MTTTEQMDIRFLTPPAMRPFSIVIATMLVAVVLANLLTPTKLEMPNPPRLDTVVPRAFGEWRELPSPLVQIDLATTRNGETSIDQPYDDTLMRAYQNSRGDVVMLALAYGQRQRQEVKIHRPELCYVAQGFSVENRGVTSFPLLDPRGVPIQGKRLFGSSLGRKEAISYWIRIGSVYSQGAFQSRMHILSEGLKGHVPDGVLVRVSQILNDNEDVKSRYELQEQFAAELVEALPESGRSLLIR